MNVQNIIYAFIAGLLPSLIWLWFWIREDTAHDEPRRILTFCFIGGMISVIVAAMLEKYITTLTDNQITIYTSWAIIEELIKFLFVYAIALRSKYVFEPIDIMIYCITTALGFAALENTLFILGPLSDGNIIASIHTGNLRFVGAELLHVVSSAMIGFALGYAHYRSSGIKAVALAIGFVTASAIHTAFNLSIINGSMSDVFKTFAWIWVAAIILIILFEEIKAVRPRLPIQT